MKFTKKLFGVLAASLLILSFFGCAGPNVTPDNGTGSGTSQNQDKGDLPKSETKVTGLHARKSNGSVKLTWTNPENDKLKSLVVIYGTASDKLDKKSPALSVNTTSYEINNLSNGTLYYFAVKTVFDGNKEYISDVVSAKPFNPSELGSLSSVDFADNLIIGWNLGNTLDASGYWNGIYNEGKKLEVNWLPEGKKVYTTEAMIKAVHAAGFETIRVPVSWHTHMAQNTTDYKIDSAWMARVKEVVDWAYNDGMFVILNIHHDNLCEKTHEDENGNIIGGIDNHPGFCLSEDSTIQKKSKAFIENVWEQIATEFASYDNHLIFEVLNEPRCIDTAWEWGWYSSGEAATAKKYSDIITAYEQVGLNKIRSISGNENRFVMVPGYAASGTNPITLGAYTLPEDSATDKLLLSTHAYSPNGFALSADMNQASFTQQGKNDLDGIFSYLKTNYTNKGIGVVMGEASATDKNNTAERIKWAQYYFGKARDASIPVVLWDNCVVWGEGTDGAERHGHFDRKNLKWYQPELIKAMVEAAGGSGDPSVVPPASDEDDDDSEGSFDPVTIFDPAAYSGSAGEVVKVGDEKFLKITIEGYDTHFELTNPVDCKGAKTFKVRCFAEDSSLDCQVQVGIKDTEYKDVASMPAMKPLVVSAVTQTGSPATGDEASQTKIVKIIQPMAVDSDWKGFGTSVVFYIGKITAE